MHPTSEDISVEDWEKLCAHVAMLNEGATDKLSKQIIINMSGDSSDSENDCDQSSSRESDREIRGVDRFYS